MSLEGVRFGAAGSGTTEIRLRDLETGDVLARPSLDGTLTETSVIAAADRLLFAERTEDTIRLGACR